MQDQAAQTSTETKRQYTAAQNAMLFYNCVMMVLILLNVIALFLDRFLVGDLGLAFLRSFIWRNLGHIMCSKSTRW